MVSNITDTCVHTWLLTILYTLTDTYLAADDPVHVAAHAPCDADVDGDCAYWRGQHLQWPGSQLPCPRALSPETRPAQGQ